MKELLNTKLFGTFEYDGLILNIYSDNYSYFMRNRDILTSLGSHNSALYSINKAMNYTKNEELKKILYIEKEDIENKMLEILRKLED